MIGERVGSYRIVSQIGAGGMGTVYLAEHVFIGSKVALKVLRPELSRNPATFARFLNEARAAAMIQHPGMVYTFDFGNLPNGCAFIAMEYLQGEDLAARLHRERPLPLPMVIDFSRQIALALAAAHAKNIIHRDLKPDNVFLTPAAEMPHQLRLKLLDFGVAKLTESESAAEPTRTGALLGTPAYMSPEQWLGARDVDARSDIYSLGCIMYEMACGRMPFEGVAPGELLSKHLYTPPDPPEQLVPAIPPRLSAVILRAMAKKPSERFQSVDEMLKELEPLSRGLGARRRSDEPTMRSTLDADAAKVLRQINRPPRSWPRIAVVASILVVVAGTGGWLLWRYEHAQAPPAKVEIHPAPPPATTVTPPVAPVEATPKVAPAAIANAVRPPPAPASPDAAVAATPPAADDKTAKTEPPAPAAPVVKHRLRFISKPPGADIVSVADGVVLGKTPATVSIAHAPKVQIALQRRGYRQQLVTLRADRDGVRKVRLLPEKKRKKTARKANIPKRSGDNLIAPPSFAR